MKKLLVLLLCVPLLFSCGEKEENDNTENTKYIRTTNLVPTPDEAIESYDGKSSTDIALSLLGPSQEQIQQQENIDRYYKSVAAGKMAQNTSFIDPIQEDASGSVSMVNPKDYLGEDERKNKWRMFFIILAIILLLALIHYLIKKSN